MWLLINNYNEVLLEKVNDVSYFVDVYLKMIGVDLVDENVVVYLWDNWVINSVIFLFEGEIVDIDFLDKFSLDII